MTSMSPSHRALVTAPFRGEGLDTLKELADVVLDPWIDYTPLRILDGPKLADRIKDEGADILIVESDFVNDPVFDLPLVAIGSCRGDPNNVDIAGATKARIPVLRAPGRNADAVAEVAIALLFAANRHVIPADEDMRSDTVFKDDTIPYQRYRAWQLAGPTAGLVGLGAGGRALGRRIGRPWVPVRGPASSVSARWAAVFGGGSKASGCRCWRTTPTPTTPRSRWTRCWPRRT